MTAGAGKKKRTVVTGDAVQGQFVPRGIGTISCQDRKSLVTSSEALSYSPCSFLSVWQEMFLFVDVQDSVNCWYVVG